MAVDYSISSGSGYSISNRTSPGLSSGSTTGTNTGLKSGDVSAASFAAAGIISAYGQSQAQQAAAINQQTGFMVSARDALVVADVRADMSEQYAAIQAGRTLKKAQIEAQNYQIAGNTLLKNLRATNASMRARAAASGIAYGEGSAAAVQRENTRNTMLDVGVADLNALTARVYGFEDASAMIQSTEYQNFLNNYTAQRQAGQYELAGTSARQQGSLLSGYTLNQGVINLARTVKT